MSEASFLLDTSTLLWALGAPERLSAPARKALKGPLVLSVVSYWEVVIKAQKGLLQVGDPVHWWSRANDLLGGSTLSVRTSHISTLAGLPGIHRDPFDRLLIAQALQERLVLITSDQTVRLYPLPTVW